jgi:hypothetical protein
MTRNAYLAFGRRITVSAFFALLPAPGSASDFRLAQPPFPNDLVLALEPDGPGTSWSENFDAYATGSEVIGQGGWEGWGGVGTVGALTSAAHARSAANSVDILGDTDLVHQYAGVASGIWVYSAWQFLPTGFAGKTYFILVNAYPTVGNQSWSVQLCFDAAGGVVRDDIAGDCTSATTLPLALDQWVEIRVVVDLTADTATVFYNNAALYSGTWSSHILAGGALSLRAVDLFANTASSAFYDDLSLVANLFLDGFESNGTTAWSLTVP